MLGFLSSVTLTVTIAANRMKIKAFGFPQNLELDRYIRVLYGETTTSEGRRLLLLFPFFWSNFFGVNSGVLFFD